MRDPCLRAAGAIAAAVLVALIGGALHVWALAPWPGADPALPVEEFSPLFPRRLEVGIRNMDRPAGRTYRAALSYEEPVETPFSGNPASVCLGSGCYLSVCMGSACISSRCLGSVCVTSGCGGSACVASGCGGSGCVTSACGGSGCVGSGCAGSACVGSACYGSACNSCGGGSGGGRMPRRT